MQGGGEAARLACWRLLDSAVDGRNLFENLAAAKPFLWTACCVEAEAATTARGEVIFTVDLPFGGVSSSFKPTRGSMSKMTGRGSSPEYAKLREED